MFRRISWCVLALVAAGCGSSQAPDAGAPDLAMAPVADLATAPDLSTAPSDLAVPGDLAPDAGALDLPALDLATAPDLAGGDGPPDANLDQNVSVDEAAPADLATPDLAMPDLAVAPDLWNGLPLDPATLAPPLDPSVPTTVAAATSFLYTDADAVQTGMTAGALVAARATVLRGRVVGPDGSALGGVAVTVHGHPELGSTRTRLDGGWDLVVNGGGHVTVHFAKSGSPDVDRGVDCDWQRWVVLPDVVMVPFDAATAIAAGMGAWQTARATASTDSDGTRRATLLLPPGTTASAVMPDGSTQPLAMLHLHMTEFTVGASGPAAMPGDLPPTTGYTYALDFHVDEAAALGAVHVQFSQPAVFYVEDFLGFPAGTTIPVGTWDDGAAGWVAAPVGRVVTVLSVSGGTASLDVDGSGAPASSTALAALGITDGELQQVASLYAAGTSLWRTPVAHFSSLDQNWAYRVPSDAVGPDGKPRGNGSPDGCCTENGSIVEIESQVLRETLPVVGTPYRLAYASNRVAGFEDAFTVDIPLSGASVPASLERIDLVVQVAGRRFTQSFAPTPSQSTKFTWDGKDAYGRTMQGRQPVEVAVGYVYKATYQVQKRWGGIAGIALTGSAARQEVTLWANWQGWVGVTAALGIDGLGGWTLDVHHVYDASARVLDLGDGTRRNDVEVSRTVIHTVGGNGVGAYKGDGGPALLGSFNHPEHLAVAADGSVYVADTWNHVIRKIDPAGNLSTVAGTGVGGYNGSEMPATSAELDLPSGVDLAPDGTIYIADAQNDLVRAVDASGVIHDVAGVKGMIAVKYDGGAATMTPFDGQPTSVTVGSDGALYVGTVCHVIRIDATGLGEPLAGQDGGGCCIFAGDGGPATMANVCDPARIRLAPDGSIWFVDQTAHRIRRISSRGIIDTVVGNGVANYNDEAGPAASAWLYDPTDMLLAPDGSLLFVDSNRQLVRAVGRDGLVRTLAGVPSATGFGDVGLNMDPDGAPAPTAQLRYPGGIALTPDGRIVVADSSNNRVRHIASSALAPPYAVATIGARDGREVYTFDATGRHMQTVDAITGVARLTFGYDGDGRLATIADADGNVTTIMRDGGGAPTSIVAPHGQVTKLALDGNGYLASVTDPASIAASPTHDAAGLLVGLVDRRGGTHAFAYDARGRLASDSDPIGGGWTLSRSDAASGFTVTATTPLGHQTSVQVTRATDGTRTRTLTLPDGTKRISSDAPDSSTHELLPDGTKRDVVRAPDPRWGMALPLAASTTITTPGGLVATTTVKRTVSTSGTTITGIVDDVTVNGADWQRAWNPSARTLTLRSPQGRKLVATLDAKGHPTSLAPGGLQSLALGYDGQGHLASVTAGARAWAYDWATSGALSSVLDPAMRTTSLTVDADLRPTALALPGARTVGTGLDADGALTSLATPAGAMHGLSWDGVGDLAGTSTPRAGGGAFSTSYVSNVERAPTKVTLADGTVATFAYDMAGRLASVTEPRGTTSLAWDGAGRLATVTAPDGGAVAYAYDGPLVTGVTWTGPVAGTLARSYDKNFRVTGDAVDGGAAVAYSYDNDGLLTGAGALSVVHDSQSGLVTSLSLGAVSDSIGRDAFGAVTSANTITGSTVLLGETLVRDVLGRETSRRETVGGVTHTYGYAYDAAGRLATVTVDGAATWQYGYDLDGNRTGVTGPSGMATASFDVADRITAQGTATYVHDPNGRRTSVTDTSGTTSYAWDAAGRLVGAVLPDGTHVDYVLDGEGRRIGKQVGGTLVAGWLYDGPRVVAQLDGGGNVAARFVYGSRRFVPDVMLAGGKTYRLVTDERGSVRLVVDTASGAIVERIDYDPTGGILSDTMPGAQPFGFGGGLYDADTKLVHLVHRDYDPATARFLTPDPILYRGGDSNLYEYAAGDPVNLTDPTGTVFLIDDMAVMVLGGTIGAIEGVATWAVDGNPTWESGVMALIGGAASGAFSSDPIVSGLSNAASTFVQDVVAQATSNCPMDWGKIALDTFGSGLLGMAAGALDVSEPGGGGTDLWAAMAASTFTNGVEDVGGGLWSYGATP